MVPTRATFNRSNLVEVEAQVHSTYQLPDRARTVVIVDQPLDVDGAQNKLGTIDEYQAR